MLEAAACDIDDGTLDAASVTWTSDKDGALGSGADLPVYRPLRRRPHDHDDGAGQRR